jgi:hypothetical protein
VGIKRKKERDNVLGEIIGPHIIQCLVVDETLWPLCYLAWKMRHEGKSLAKIHRATHLYSTVKGYSYFFKNRIYTGDYAHGGVLYENFVPALIPPEWYEEEQIRRQARGKKRKGEEMLPKLEPRRVASTSLLSGKLQCVTVEGENTQCTLTDPCPLNTAPSGMPMNAQSISIRTARTVHFMASASQPWTHLW